MSQRGIDELLERLVAQFASPYDFLREVVQNAMDAGSDLLDVTLFTHATDDEGCVFELEIADAGEGMDEAIIDGELTRLFASSKTDDRTMAGGFGIGFVSVFAWDPEVVLLHTGRRDESWELVFHRDRRFEKHAVDEPIDGTTLRLFRRGRPEERASIANAIYDSLWRWCRYCPIEVTFEDAAGEEGPLLIQDAPLPDEAAASVEVVDGEDVFRLAFAVPPHAVLLRHGLVLAEGAPVAHMPRLSAQLGSGARHLRVWADSPRLRTTLARDQIVDDKGLAHVEATLVTKVDDLRGQLLQRARALVEADGNWTPARHDELAYLHAHLACERGRLGDELADVALLRAPSGVGLSIRALARRSKLGLVALVEPGAPEPEALELIAAGLRGGIPAVFGSLATDAVWLAPLLAQGGLRARPLHELLSRVEPESDDELTTSVRTALARAGMKLGPASWGRYVDAAEPPVFGWRLSAGVAAHGHLPITALPGAALVFDPRHDLCVRCRATSVTQLATAALAFAVVGSSDGAPASDEVLEAVRLG